MDWTKGKFRFTILAFLWTVVFWFCVIPSCKPVDQDLQVKVETGTISETGYTYALVNGKLVDTGKGSIEQYGFCFGTSENPTIVNSNTKLGSRTSAGDFTDSLQNLETETTYFVRAYAIAQDENFYGDQVSFTTLKPTSPVVVLSSVGEYKNDTIKVIGNVSDDGGLAVTARGVCWSLEENPEVTGTHSADGTGTGTFNCVITGMERDTIYYIRAYAMSAVDISYSDQLQVRTPPFSVTIKTTPITGITQTTAETGGAIVSNDGPPITGRGICWSTTANPDLSGDHTSDDSETGSFTSSITGLTAGTTYYVRAYGTSSSGVYYGDELSFTTTVPPAALAIVSTFDASNILVNSADVGGNVSSDGGALVFERGIYYGTSSNPQLTGTKEVVESGIGAFTISLTDLLSGVRYYYTAFAENSVGTAWGKTKSFITKDPVVLAAVRTEPAENIGSTQATLGGYLSDEGGGMVIDQGVYYGIEPNPENTGTKIQAGIGAGTFSIQVASLSPDTRYYFIAYAFNEAGRSLGSVAYFDTKPETVSDIEDNVYQTVKIGNQVWMSENLKVTKYPDGSGIQYVTSSSAWAGLDYTDGAYCYYDNSSANGDTYGALYTWSAAMNGASSSNANPSGIQGVCPDGWHLPSDNEWKDLEEYLGMAPAISNMEGYRGTAEGGKLKDDSDLWNDPNTGVTNSARLSVLPGGYRYDNGTYEGLGQYADLWTSTSVTNSDAWTRQLRFDGADIRREPSFKDNGAAIRCVKD